MFNFFYFEKKQFFQIYNQKLFNLYKKYFFLNIINLYVLILHYLF